MLKKLWKDEEGLTSIEYALLLVLVAIAAATAITTIKPRVTLVPLVRPEARASYIERMKAAS